MYGVDVRRRRAGSALSPLWNRDLFRIPIVRKRSSQDNDRYGGGELRASSASTIMT
jgi:hypothetical protein